MIFDLSWHLMVFWRTCIRRILPFIPERSNRSPWNSPSPSSPQRSGRLGSHGITPFLGDLTVPYTSSPSGRERLMTINSVVIRPLLNPRCGRCYHYWREKTHSINGRRATTTELCLWPSSTHISHTFFLMMVKVKVLFPHHLP